MKKHRITPTPRAKHSRKLETVAVYLLPEEIACCAAILTRYRKDFLRPFALHIAPEEFLILERYLDTVEDILSSLRKEEGTKDIAPQQDAPL